MRDITPARRAELADAGRKGAAGRWAGTTAEERREQAEHMRRGRRTAAGQIEALEERFAAELEALRAEVAELRDQRVAA